jgi:hypothetical protein
MVDVARQNHPVEWLRKMVDVCRFYKVRYLQLHLTDDQGWTFPSTKYPQLGTKNYGAHGGVAPKVYNLDELRALVAYADARGVTLVPEMEVPGHSGAALRALPEVFDAVNPKTKQPVGLGCMNMANEAIYPALDTIIGEMCDVFKSSPYFHVGGDEVSMGRVSLHPGYKAFMEKHGLKNDEELGRHFIVQVNEIVKKHGRKTLKWEGLANEASKDIIVVCWDKNNNTARRLIDKGYTTLTCPWDLGVPWQDWNMYVCNGSKLKPGDAVIGAMLVAWEQSPQVHLSGTRNVASRQERTWNPEHTVTEQGFASRFQALDAAVGKLIGIPVMPRLEVDFATSVGTNDLLAPAFAFDGNDATFFRSSKIPSAGDHFTVSLKTPRLMHAIEVLTGINDKGLLDGGEIQTSTDGIGFTTVATLAKGSARASLTEKRVSAVRIVAKSKQADQLVIREIKLHLLVEVVGLVKDAAVVGAGNIALLKGDAIFAASTGATPIINQGFKLTLKNAGTYVGPISGEGAVELDGTITLAGKLPNALKGTWTVKNGQLVLAKESGVQAVGGSVTIHGGASIVWNNRNQLGPNANVKMLDSAKGGAVLNLNGFRESIDNLAMAKQSRIQTDGTGGAGVLRVGKLTIDGNTIAKGIYTASTGCVQGRGYVVVGNVKSVEVAGNVNDPQKTIGNGNLAVLKAATVIKLGKDDCAAHIDCGAFPLTLSTDGIAARYSGFITGNGLLTIDARQPLEIAGAASNAFRGTTVLARGVLKLTKSKDAIAIPGDLFIAGDGVILGDYGQLASSSVVTLAGNQPAYFDLNGHRSAFARLVLSKAGTVRTGKDGALTVKQLYIDGKRLTDRVYKAPQPWLDGPGAVTVDARVDVKGTLGNPDAQIGHGNIANLIGNAAFVYPVGDCNLDVITNGHTITFDSGDGNPLCHRGAISGTGDVVFLMGPSRTDYKDAPLRLAGDKPNTTTGKFYVRKGRVQLEKPDGVDAISGDVIVGGQGLNDCLFWVHSNQIKDNVNITLIGAGNNGAAYLHLNGCNETVAGLTMIAGNTVKTDSATGVSGVLTVRSLTIDGTKMPAGTYTSANTRWLEGKGRVIVQP